MAIRILGARSVPKQVNRANIMADTPPPLSFQAVQRILERNVQNDGLPGLGSRFSLIEWDELPDGTTVCVIENDWNGVRYHFTVCPITFKPINLGPVDQ